eukprot:6182364-Pleurochrysis_carterae.AAC.5
MKALSACKVVGTRMTRDERQCPHARAWLEEVRATEARVVKNCNGVWLKRTRKKSSQKEAN